jgi:hypothetical protein
LTIDDLAFNLQFRILNSPEDDAEEAPSVMLSPFASLRVTCSAPFFSILENTTGYLSKAGMLLRGKGLVLDNGAHSGCLRLPADLSRLSQN